jgi:hypothetical protein
MEVADPTIREARALMPSFAALLEDKICTTTPSPAELALADVRGGEPYFPFGVTSHPTTSATPIKLTLRCTDAAAAGLLEAVRDRVRHLAASLASRNAAANGEGRPLVEVFAAIALLRDRVVEQRVEASEKRKVSEVRLLALRLAKCSAEQLLAESERLVESAPDFAPSRLQRAETLLAAGHVEDAVAQIWIGVLLLGVEEILEAKALSLLARCQQSAGVAGVRLDISVLADGAEASTRCPEQLIWSHLTSAQQSRHREIVARIPPTNAVPVGPRQTRLVVMSTIPSTKLQRYFSWIVPHRLAVASTPCSREDVIATAALGITTIITLTMEEPLYAPWFEGQPIRNVSIPVKNMHPPTVHQVDAIVAEILVSNATGGQTLLHCGGGKGRAGTAAAAYFMVFGQRGHPSLCGPCRDKHRTRKRAQMTVGSCSADARCGLAQREPKMAAMDAIALIRGLRPGSIESERQERFLHEYGSELWRRAYALPEAAAAADEESTTAKPVRVIGSMPPGFPRLIVLCGVRLLSRMRSAAKRGESSCSCTWPQVLTWSVLNYLLSFPRRHSCPALASRTSRPASFPPRRPALPSPAKTFFIRATLASG